MMQFLSMLLGAIIVQVVFILSVNIKKYYSGIDPYSTMMYVPIFVFNGMIIGGTILLVMNMTKERVITEPKEYLIFGLVLGLTNINGILHIWWGSTNYTDTFILVFLIILASIMVIKSTKKKKLS